jgi:hypothetical protein
MIRFAAYVIAPNRFLKGKIMKQLSILLALLMSVLAFASCSKSESSNISASSNSGSNNTNTSVEKISSSESVNFSKVFQGTINNQFPIEMSLQRNGEDLSGSYFYTKVRTDIPIKGTIDGQDNFIINEFDSKGNQTGVFKGRFVSKTAMEGNWSKPSGEKLMPFSLSEKTNGEIASTSNATNSSQGVSSISPTVNSSSSSSADDSKPSRDKIKSDCRELVSGTIGQAYVIGKGIVTTGRYMDFVDADVQGISSEGVTAQAVVLLTVRYNSAFAETNRFYGTLAGCVPVSDINNKGQMLNQTRRISLKMLYRKYDTGWRLENWSGCR